MTAQRLRAWAMAQTLCSYRLLICIRKSTHLMPRLRTTGARLLLPPYAFMPCTGTTIPFSTLAWKFVHLCSKCYMRTDRKTDIYTETKPAFSCEGAKTWPWFNLVGVIGRFLRSVTTHDYYYRIDRSSTDCHPRHRFPAKTSIYPAVESGLHVSPTAEMENAWSYTATAHTSSWHGCTRHTEKKC